MAGATISVHAETEVTRVSVSGELDMEATGAVLAAVQRCLEGATCKQVRVNLAGVSFCDSSGLGELAEARTHCVANGVEFVLERPDPRVMRLLELTGMDTVFEIAS